MAALSLAMGVAAGICAVLAGIYWYRGSAIKPTAAWDYDPTLRPKDMRMYTFGMIHALEAANFWSGEANKKAAAWAIAAALLTVGAAVTGWLAAQPAAAQNSTVNGRISGGVGINNGTINNGAPALNPEAQERMQTTLDAVRACMDRDGLPGDPLVLRKMIEPCVNDKLKQRGYAWRWDAASDRIIP